MRRAGCAPLCDFSYRVLRLGRACFRRLPCSRAAFVRLFSRRAMSSRAKPGHQHQKLSRPSTMELFEAKKKEVEVWMGKQPPSVEVAVATGSGAVQGGLIGAMMATFSSMEPPGGAAASMAPKARIAAARCTSASRARCATRRVARRALIAPRMCSRRAWLADRPCSLATSPS